jgi:hypothetical protein
MNITNVGPAVRSVALDIDDNIAQQVLGRAAIVEVASYQRNDRRTSVQTSGAKVAFCIVGENFGHRRPVAIVHGTGEQGQRSLDIALISEAL